MDDIKHINEHLLEAYCCDDGEMGTYSVSREADVWQQLVGAFPNIFEWLMTDPTDSEIAHFKGLVETLTKLRAHFNYGAPDVDPDWTYTAHGRDELARRRCRDGGRAGLHRSSIAHSTSRG